MVHPAHSVPQMDPIVASGTLHRSIACGENDRLSAIRNDHLRLGLRARPLLYQDEFSAFPVAALLPEQEYHLKRKTHLAIKILM